MNAARGLCLLFLCLFAIAHGEEPDDTQIITRILDTRQQIVGNFATNNTGVTPMFLAFWDFDGTILKGDCSEGLKLDGKTRYAGLAQVAIERGFSSLYPPQDGFDRFWNDYTNMEARIGPWLAYPFIPQMLRGASAEAVLALSSNYFNSTLSNYLMASSVKLIHALQQAGVEVHIVSASADLFVKGAATSLGLPPEHIHGIEVRVRDGRLAEEIMYPVTWNRGKLEKIQNIVADIENKASGRKAFILAGFGDSYSTDGPFLKFIATQHLPAGKPISVFYDSKQEPDEYRGLFYQARHLQTVGKP